MALFGKGQRKPGWLAVQFSSGRINLAHVVREAAERPKVLRCETHPAAEIPGLEKLRKEEHLEQYRCTTLLSPSEYQILQVEAPNVPPAELKTAIRWRIKDLLDYHIEDAAIDVLDIPTDKSAPSRSHSMYAVAARNEIIQKRIVQFEQAKIPLSVIDIPEMAQRNIAALFEQPGRALGLLSFDETGGLLTFTRDGELHLMRRMDITSGEIMDADPALRRQVWDRVVLELQRSLDHLERQYHYLTLSRLLLAPIPEGEPFIEHLKNNLYVPIEVLDLSGVMDVAGAPELTGPDGQAQYFRVVGAGLRQEEKVL